MIDKAAASLIISVSGLRGTVGGSLTREVVQRYIFAFASYMKRCNNGDSHFPQPFLISTDGRESGSWIVSETQRAFEAAGIRSLFLGTAATPTLGFLVRYYHAPGGVQITASHNSLAWNGIKLFDAAGGIISHECGEKVKRFYDNLTLDEFALDSDFEQEEEPNEDSLKQMLAGDPLECQKPHWEAILKLVDAAAIKKRKFTVFLDSNRGSGSVLGREMLQALGCKVIFPAKIEKPDGNFVHEPEPTAENLKKVCKKIAENGAVDIGFCQDPDADRLALVAGDGTYLGEECTLSLCVRDLLDSGKKGPIVTNCSSSLMTYDIAKKAGCECFFAPVGEANVVAKMMEVGAIFGGEGNGGTIHPAVGFVRDSFVGMAMILDLLARSGKSILELAKELPKYYIVKHKIEFRREKLASFYEELCRMYPDAEADMQDGCRLSWKNAWVLIRPSNTEPIIRVIGEAKTLKKINDICAEILKMAASW